MRFFLLGLLLLLPGCVTTGSNQGDISNVCDALSANANPAQPGPIRYTSKTRASSRFAGPALAPDLATRNRIGIELHCPGFTRNGK